jgi:hypothetical protein
VHILFHCEINPASHFSIYFLVSYISMVADHRLDAPFIEHSINEVFCDIVNYPSCMVLCIFCPPKVEL